MRILIPSALAIALAAATPGLAQETPEETARDIEPGEIARSLGEATADARGDQGSTLAVETLAAGAAATDRNRLGALIGEPVRDAEGAKVGVVNNFVMTDGAASLRVIKLDGIAFARKELRAVPAGDAVAADEAVALLSLTKAELRKQSDFVYEAGMDTIAPVTDAVDDTNRRS